tara:strand:+ start:569 stop:976 length:408 start_codon:yes stop_codon:yes gene_type:complete
VIVGIVGSRTYQDKRKVKDFIFQLRQRFGSELVVLSGGQKDGADYLAKKYSLELDVEYREYPPFHYPYNIHCVLPEEVYGKTFKMSYYFVRNKQIAKACDKLVAFVTKGNLTDSPGTTSTIKYIKKMGKDFIILT